MVTSPGPLVAVSDRVDSRYSLQSTTMSPGVRDAMLRYREHHNLDGPNTAFLLSAG